MTTPDNVVELNPRRTVAYLPLLGVCVAVLISLGLLLVDFRLGVIALAMSVGAAVVLRATLSTRQAGLLVVRGKVFDVVLLSALAGALTVLAVIVPPPS